MPSVSSIIGTGIVVLLGVLPYVAKPILEVSRKMEKNRAETKRCVDEYILSIPLIAEGLVRIERGQDLSDFPFEEIPDPEGTSFRRADKYLRKHTSLAIAIDERISELMDDHRYGMLAA